MIHKFYKYIVSIMCIIVYYMYKIIKTIICYQFSNFIKISYINACLHRKIKIFNIYKHRNNE